MKLSNTDKLGEDSLYRSIEISKAMKELKIIADDFEAAKACNRQVLEQIDEEQT